MFNNIWASHSWGVNRTRHSRQVASTGRIAILCMVWCRKDSRYNILLVRRLFSCCDRCAIVILRATIVLRTIDRFTAQLLAGWVYRFVIPLRNMELLRCGGVWWQTGCCAQELIHIYGPIPHLGDCGFAFASFANFATFMSTARWVIQYSQFLCWISFLHLHLAISAFVLTPGKKNICVRWWK